MHKGYCLLCFCLVCFPSQARQQPRVGKAAEENKHTGNRSEQSHWNRAQTSSRSSNKELIHPLELFTLRTSKSLTPNITFMLQKWQTAFWLVLKSRCYWLQSRNRLLTAPLRIRSVWKPPFPPPVCPQTPTASPYQVGT